MKKFVIFSPRGKFATCPESVGNGGLNETCLTDWRNLWLALGLFKVLRLSDVQNQKVLSPVPETEILWFQLRRVILKSQIRFQGVTVSAALHLLHRERPVGATR